MTGLSDVAVAITRARSSVFRFEGHQHYADDPQWRTFEEGADWRSNDDLRGWCQLAESLTARGVSMRRVHVVTEPWTPYVQFEVEQHYPVNSAAGEDVRLVRTSTPWAVPDFWLVDDAQGWLLHYDENGVLGSVVEASPRALPSLLQWRDEALAAAAPLGAVPAS